MNVLVDIMPTHDVLSIATARFAWSDEKASYFRDAFGVTWRRWLPSGPPLPPGFVLGEP